MLIRMGGRQILLGQHIPLPENLDLRIQQGENQIWIAMQALMKHQRVSIGDIFPKNIGLAFPLFW